MNLSPKHNPKLKSFFSLVDLKKHYLKSSVPTFIMLAATQGYSADEQAHALMYIDSTLPKEHPSRELILRELIKLPAIDVIVSLSQKKTSYHAEGQFALKFIDLKLQQLPKSERAKQRAVLELAYITGSRYPSVKTIEKYCGTAQEAARAGFYMPLAAVACNIMHCGQEFAAQGAKTLHSLLADMPTTKARIQALDEALTQLPKDPVSFVPLRDVTTKLAKKMPDPRDKAELILRVASHMHKADPRAEDSFIKLFLECFAKNHAQGLTALHDAQKEMGSHFAHQFFMTAAIQSPTFPAALAADVVDYLLDDKISMTKRQKSRIHCITLENLRTQPLTSGPTAHFRKLLMVHILEDDLDITSSSTGKIHDAFNQISDGYEKTSLAHDCVHFALNSKQQHAPHWLAYAHHIVQHHHDVTEAYTRFNMLGDAYALCAQAQHEEKLPLIVKALIEANNDLDDHDQTMAWGELANKVGSDAMRNITPALQNLKPAPALKP